MAPHAPKTDVVADVQAAAPVFPKVNWRKSPNMRKLYFYAAVLCIASATTGYDGSMLNAMQFFPSWVSYMDTPSGVVLGRLSAMYQIGSLSR